MKARGVELEYTDVVGDLNAEKLKAFDGLVLFANIDKIEVERESEPMKARLYYLRDRQGKAAVQVKEKRFEDTASAS